ncbi:hypothetical protein Q1W73_13745 [Asticcacaulis sp. ZE23SCel15]|uniref:hypothetical protein n=1 Tax=Asticcacaulis sp. ZE23SCel15 TaxID=3059027 RepID=UPI00265DEEED|nr:hypothetical protein [Asticcacaulis sp. ZE23SCel15]WKL56724.1 hypothetical protein Q1W73_13745 [Asticcacaulis sp. ZE23SCel15]
MVLPPITSWDDIGAIASIIFGPAIVLSLYAAFRQIRAQAEVSRRELSFNGMIAFNEKFERSSDMYQSVHARFANDDRSVNFQTAKQVFNGYWRLVHEEFVFFKAGLIPMDIFVGWMQLSYSQIAGDLNIPYFAKDGSEQAINSRERFETIILNGRYHNHPDFCTFFTDVYNLRAPGCADAVLPKAARYRIIDRYVRTYARRHKIKPVI